MLPQYHIFFENMNEQKEKHIYTVSELTKYVRVILEDSFPAVWIEGEISNFVLHSSGHMYFSLRDAGAVLKCAMFARSNAKLKFRPKDGMKVICFGKLSLYISKSLNPRSYWVNSAEKIKKTWLKNAKSVGITAGASTPESSIKEIIAKIKTISL